ncbi:MAG: hypothetical protein BGO01_04250 [Armatimonadetes bacterium 55-13]|nr:metallophosphoesterase [Armatimonadota bacterium]OJU63360.1 MAG: hypothetical protein BGO01_04250 [Armatimonadetes bacterium 55-13]
MRLVHLTDIHVQPERDAFEGLVRAFEVAFALDPTPEALLIGGDTVMNTVSADWDRASQLWELWNRARSQFPAIPTFACLGNQDVWGWNQKASGCTGSEPMFGKRLAMDRLGMSSSYGAYRLGPWRILVLDSIQRGGKHGFEPMLGAEQWAWLENELSADRLTPTLVLSHVSIVPGPIDLFAMNLMGPNEKNIWPLPRHQVHVDSYRLHRALSAAGNVRLCLTGHTHASQRIDLDGVTYFSGPSVSGAWWRGEFLGNPAGLTVVDLSDDGEFRLRVVACDQESIKD